MQTKTSPPWQYVATALMGIFALMIGMMVIQKKQTQMLVVSKDTPSHEHTVAPQSLGKSNTLEDLCKQKQCQWDATQDECICKEATSSKL